MYNPSLRIALFIRWRETEPGDESENTAGAGARPEGGYTVTSPLLPELLTEGDIVAEALANVEDAFGAVVEIYQDRDRPLPSNLYLEDANCPLSVETVVSLP